MQLDVPADDPAAAPFEAFRTAAGGPEATWLVGEITVPDRTDGTGRSVTFVEAGADPMDDDPLDPDDGISNAEFACSSIDEWFTGITEPDDAIMADWSGLVNAAAGRADVATSEFAAAAGLGLDDDRPTRYRQSPPTPTRRVPG